MPNFLFCNSSPTDLNAWSCSSHNVPFTDYTPSNASFPTMRLEQLPPEILSEIMMHLQVQDFHAFIQLIVAGQQFWNVALGTPGLWTTICLGLPTAARLNLARERGSDVTPADLWSRIPFFDWSGSMLIDLTISLLRDRPGVDHADGMPQYLELLVEQIFQHAPRLRSLAIETCRWQDYGVLVRLLHDNHVRMPVLQDLAIRFDEDFNAPLLDVVPYRPAEDNAAASPTSHQLQCFLSSHRETLVVLELVHALPSSSLELEPVTFPKVREFKFGFKRIEDVRKATTFLLFPALRTLSLVDGIPEDKVTERRHLLGTLKSWPLGQVTHLVLDSFWFYHGFENGFLHRVLFTPGNEVLVPLPHDNDGVTWFSELYSLEELTLLSANETMYAALGDPGLFEDQHAALPLGTLRRMTIEPLDESHLIYFLRVRSAFIHSPVVNIPQLESLTLDVKPESGERLHRSCRPELATRIVNRRGPERVFIVNDAEANTLF
ncbi:hypothetical protein PQX77_016280 [Marasmius sp. AFHP31]|nr:hypothetical protein PQX77_016280 [Marasmius sp. AFHP31]